MALQRIRYREREVLTAGMLGQEQAWRIAMLRRHLIAAHVWGVVTGLALEADAGGLHIQPGHAVDGYGRELTLTKVAHVLPAGLNDVAGAQGVAVWLLYSDGRYTEGRLARRASEEPEIRLTPFDPALDPGMPGEVPEADLNFPPLFIETGDTELIWPVFLGRVRAVAGGFRADTEGRPAAGAVGETLADPAGTAGMQVGTETSLLQVTTGGVSRIDLKTGGTVAITGPASVAGDLRLVPPEGSTDVPSGMVLSPPVITPEAAQPWSIYRTLAPLQPAGPPVDQLRFEIRDPGEKADPAKYRLAVGHRRSQGEEFLSCFEVSADSNVRLLGKLTVEGELLEGPVKVTSEDPRLSKAVLDSYLDGVTAGGNALEDQFTGGINIDVQPGISSATVTLTNSGSAVLRDWVAYLVVKRRGASVLPSTEIGSGASLPGTAVWKYPSALAGELTLEVSVFAVAPPSRVVQGKDSVIINIPEPLPPTTSEVVR